MGPGRFDGDELKSAPHDVASCTRNAPSAGSASCFADSPPELSKLEKGSCSSQQGCNGEKNTRITLQLFVAVLDVVANSLPVTQIDVHNLAMTCKAVNACVCKRFFSSATGSRVFLDSFSFIQPMNKPIIHKALIPLVLEGFMPIEKAVLSPLSALPGSAPTSFRNAIEANGMGADLSARYEALKATDVLGPDDIRSLNTLARSRTRGKLHELLSCSSIWALALRLIKFKDLKQVSPMMQALLGPKEQAHLVEATFMQTGCKRNSKGQCKYGGMCDMNVALHTRLHNVKRCLTKQWAICRWLHHQVRCLRNRNVKAFLYSCVGKRIKRHRGSLPIRHKPNQDMGCLLRVSPLAPLQRTSSASSALSSSSFSSSSPPQFPRQHKPPSPNSQTMSVEFIKLLAESSVARNALSSCTIDFFAMLRLYHQCGLGHIKHLLTPQGVKRIRSGQVTVDDLERLPAHYMVQALLDCPGLFTADGLANMAAPPQVRKQIVQLIVKCFRESSKSDAENAFPLKNDTVLLLRLSSLDAVEFATSKIGRAGLKNGILNLERDLVGMEFSVNHHRILSKFFSSESGPKLLVEGLVSIPKLLKCVQNPNVLEPVLSPRGSAALRQGHYSLDALSKVVTVEQALSVVQGGTNIAAAAATPSATAVRLKTKAAALEANTYNAKEANTPNTSSNMKNSKKGMGHALTKQHEHVTQWARLQHATRFGTHYDAQGLDDPDNEAGNSNEHGNESERDTAVEEIMSRLSCSAEQACAALRGANWNIDVVLAEQVADTTPFFGCALNAITAVEEREREREAEINAPLDSGCESGDNDPFSDTNNDGDEGFDAGLALDEHRADQEHKRECVDQFLSAAQSLACRREDAIVFLRAARWHVETALDNFRNQSKRPRSFAAFSPTRTTASNGATLYPKHLGSANKRPKLSETIAEPTSEQLSTLLKFFEVTGVKTENLAVSFLSMCGWDLESAVSTYLATKT